VEKVNNKMGRKTEANISTSFPAQRGKGRGKKGSQRLKPSSKVGGGSG
jgi:hypothetical protein